MLKTILLIGTGGFFGSVARYLVQDWFLQLTDNRIPWGTFTANMLGSFIIGIIYAIVARQGYFSSEIKLLLAVGFCGGFTTFSSFAAENLNLLREGAFFPFAAYTLLSVATGLLMVYVGMSLVKLFS